MLTDFLFRPTSEQLESDARLAGLADRAVRWCDPAARDDLHWQLHRCGRCSADHRHHDAGRVKDPLAYQDIEGLTTVPQAA
ncbi:hypothetical protein [Streptomyces sp. NPDC005799]|uniref:hypothetical protein n=1 Tax=Streptomyces sp. NPDC005799 TaxID=3154678 RepID=UPI0033C3CE49